MLTLWRNNVKPQIKATLVVSIVPTIVVSMMFYILLGHRRDYLGHTLRATEAP